MVGDSAAATPGSTTRAAAAAAAVGASASEATDRSELRREVFEALRVLIVAGIPTGVLIGGIGSRLAMLLLRITSGERVHGLTSDDGFEIGSFTLSGTYNLLMLGATVGVIGAAAYQWVRPWLLGPAWFRYATVAAGSGIVVGSMLIHADGVDFTALTPTWLTIATFVALPAMFGAAIGPAVEAALAHRAHQAAGATEGRSARPSSGRRAWLLPAVLVGAFAFSLFPLVIAAGVLMVWGAARRDGSLRELARQPALKAAVRAVCVAVVVFGLVALVGDITEIYDVR